MQASNTLEVVPHGAGDAHPAVGVFDPLNRHLVQPHVHVAREEQQLGVEEPAIVFHEREERLRGIGAQCLEPALRVVKGGRNAALSTAMYPRLSTSRLGDRLTPRLGERRDPIAMSASSDVSGATSLVNAARSVERSMSM